VRPNVQNEDEDRKAEFTASHIHMCTCYAVDSYFMNLEAATLLDWWQYGVDGWI